MHHDLKNETLTLLAIETSLEDQIRGRAIEYKHPLRVELRAIRARLATLIPLYRVAVGVDQIEIAHARALGTICVSNLK